MILSVPVQNNQLNSSHKYKYFAYHFLKMLFTNICNNVSYQTKTGISCAYPCYLFELLRVRKLTRAIMVYGYNIVFLITIHVETKKVVTKYL